MDIEAFRCGFILNVGDTKIYKYQRHIVNGNYYLHCDCRCSPRGHLHTVNHGSLSELDPYMRDFELAVKGWIQNGCAVKRALARHEDLHEPKLFGIIAGFMNKEFKS